MEDTSDCSLTLDLLGTRKRRAQICSKALKERKITDCVFLVGPDDGEQEEVFAVKAMMIMLSPFMKGLFNSDRCPPPPGPIRIKNIQRKIFHLVIEFVHAGHLETPVSCEEVVDLAVAADYLLIDSLKELCTLMIKQKTTVNNFWATLNYVMRYNLTNVADGLSEIMFTKTTECLQHPDFLTAEAHSLVYFLKQQEMTLKSEMALIEFCSRWAKNQSDTEQAMLNILPHLRLLTLSAGEIAKLPDVLEHSELAALLKYTVTFYKQLPGKPLPTAICPLLKRRDFYMQESDANNQNKNTPMHQFIVRKYFANEEVSQLSEAQKYATSGEISNTLHVRSKHDIVLTGVGYICKIHGAPKLVFDQSNQTYVLSSQEKSYKSDLVSEIRPNLRQEANCSATWEYNRITHDCIQYKTNIPFIPRGKLFMIVLREKNKNLSRYRNLKMEDVNAALRKELEWNKGDFETLEFRASDNDFSMPVIIRSFLYIKM